MYLLILVSLLLITVVIMLFKKTATIIFQFNTNSDEMYLLLEWFKPLLHVKVRMIDYAPYVSIKLFGMNIYSKTLSTVKRKKTITLDDYRRSLVLSNTYANVYYGLSDPFATGITNGFVQIIQSFFNGVLIKQFPDFLPDREYLIINAGTELNMGKTIFAIIRMKLNSGKMKRRVSYGSN